MDENDDDLEDDDDDNDYNGRRMAACLGAVHKIRKCFSNELAFNPLDTNVKFDAYVPTGGPFGPLLVHRDIANFRPQNKA